MEYQPEFLFSKRIYSVNGIYTRSLLFIKVRKSESLK